MVACASSKTREASHQTFLNYCSCYITAHQNSLLSAVTQRSGECFSVVPLRLFLSFFFLFFFSFSILSCVCVSSYVLLSLRCFGHWLSLSAGCRLWWSSRRCFEWWIPQAFPQVRVRCRIDCCLHHWQGDWWCSECDQGCSCLLVPLHGAWSKVLRPCGLRACCSLGLQWNCEQLFQCN